MWLAEVKSECILIELEVGKEKISKYIEEKTLHFCLMDEVQHLTSFE